MYIRDLQNTCTSHAKKKTTKKPPKTPQKLCKKTTIKNRTIPPYSP